MTGFTLKCLDQNADRISVQSSLAPTWAPMRRKWRFLPAKGYEVSVARDEVVVIKTRGDNTVTLVAHDEKLVVRSSRNGVIALWPKKARELELSDGEALTIRTIDARDPDRPHRTDLLV